MCEVPHIPQKKNMLRYAGKRESSLEKPMKTKETIIKKNTIVCYEVEFADMDHTLIWLLETAEKYNCTKAIQHLNTARKLITQKKTSLFDPAASS